MKVELQLKVTNEDGSSYKLQLSEARGIELSTELDDIELTYFDRYLPLPRTHQLIVSGIPAYTVIHKTTEEKH